MWTKWNIPFVIFKQKRKTKEEKSGTECEITLEEIFSRVPFSSYFMYVPSSKHKQSGRAHAGMLMTKNKWYQNELDACVGRKMCIHEKKFFSRSSIFILKCVMLCNGFSGTWDTQAEGTSQ